ncbi:MAG: hypothetical protein ABF265_09720 [Polaribacter sp.]
MAEAIKEGDLNVSKILFFIFLPTVLNRKGICLFSTKQYITSNPFLSISTIPSKMMSK